MTPADLSRLNTGPYTGAPTDYKPEIRTKDDVFAIESRRLLAYLVAPDEIDPDINVLANTRILNTSYGTFNDVLGVMPSSFQPVAERNNMLGGVFTSRTNGSIRAKKSLNITVMRFPSDSSARTAAAEFEQVITTGNPLALLIPLTTNGDTHAILFSDSSGTLFAQHGPYMITALLALPQPDRTALTHGLNKTLEAQTARLNNTKPTQTDDMLDLPQNPEGIMRLALQQPNKGGDAWLQKEAIGFYAAAGALHFERDITGLRRIFAETGADLVAWNDGTVYRVRDLASAFKLQAALTKLGRDDEEIPNPPGITDARCIKLDVKEPIRDYIYICAVVYGRYVAVVGARRGFSEVADPSFFERVTAQYSILAKSG
ncbi:DUF7373 family lipoprotein [Nocardia transvalensis]|uniref:DUF7373 family lipoprotein n=1 Tax=Nocardia transvalensis TaxID=37333 RepID=UPI0018939C9A|nr:hypothetical protein [Nocardia transvalensis]MBF6327476.1 hypothetical protein [Nocardia transvalensis]